MRQLRWGMIGGGEGAFIGAVHRMAARLDGRYQLLAGVFSSDAEKTKRSAIALGVDPARAYPSVDAMLKAEAARPDGIEVVSIVTPNHVHYVQSAACLEAGLDVICDKPLTTNLADAEKLVALAAAKKRLLGVTFNYTGYPMIRHAKQLIADGLIGKLRVVQAEYPQGWLATALEKTGQKQASWRTDPKLAGAGALGDIGSHSFQLAEFVTGAKVSEVAADVSAIVPGRAIDDNVNVLLRFADGARGSLWASQVAIGKLNSHRLRVYGEAGSIEWFQERPEELLVVEAGGSPQTVRRGDPGTPTSSVALPGGHPEGFIEAFSQLYTDFAERVSARLESRSPKAASLFAPDAITGTRVMAFIEAVLKSGQANSAWTKI
ncbi:MAG TPA: Gfo/Idh/MocA family oxidoreductase [Steroidobacteraceae bacterium]|jgi:predicted dehydrogenase|nr:Gfo/Idh/MocA family oxidoreductase [Steroidobacteraceae bacterium]